MTKTSSNGRGGRRPGAGRKPGSGPYGEPTRPVRVPVSLVPTVRSWLTHLGRHRARPFAQVPTTLLLPLYGSRIAAGFPSPADDHQEDSLDLNEYLVKHPAATFFVRVEGDSMTGAGIHHGDLLVVDRAIEPKAGHIVVAVVDGELTVKRLEAREGRLWLMPENPAYPPLEIREGMEFLIWGVVAHAVRSF